MRAYGQLWVKPVKSADSQLIGSDHHWRVRHLLLAPHRLGFFLAMLVLVASAAWWLLVQFDRVSVTVALPYVTSPTLVHATAMTFGFFPLFFRRVLSQPCRSGCAWKCLKPACSPYRC